MSLKPILIFILHKIYTLDYHFDRSEKNVSSCIDETILMANILKIFSFLSFSLCLSLFGTFTHQPLFCLSADRVSLLFLPSPYTHANCIRTQLYIFQHKFEFMGKRSQDFDSLGTTSSFLLWSEMYIVNTFSPLFVNILSTISIEQ